MCGRCIDIFPSKLTGVEKHGFLPFSLRHFYTLLQYSPNHVNTDTEGPMESVRIKRVEFRENVGAFSKDKENCP